MAYFSGTIAHGSTGTKTIPVGFQPIGVRITVGQRFNTADNFTHQSVGISDGVDTNCTSIFQDTTGGKTVSSNRLASHFERVGGTITEVLAIDFHSFTATSVKYTVVTANASYNLLIEAWG